MAADTKAYTCYDCREVVICQNCGRNMQRLNMFSTDYPGWCGRCRAAELKRGKSFKVLYGKDYTHPSKGKTYKQIYKGRSVKYGFQKGEENIAKQPEIRKKISQGVKNSYTPELREIRRAEFYGRLFKKGMAYGKLKFKNSQGQLFRSSLEVSFSELLLKNNIPYIYEHRIKLYDGRVKVVDFLVNEHILVEISGFAYTAWQEDFIYKVEKLRNSVENLIVILTYPEHVDTKTFYRLVSGKNIFIGNVYNNERILSTLSFCDLIKSLSKYNAKGDKICMKPVNYSKLSMHTN